MIGWGGWWIELSYILLNFVTISDHPFSTYRRRATDWRYDLFACFWNYYGCSEPSFSL